MELHAGAHHSEWDAARYNEHHGSFELSVNAKYWLFAFVALSVALTVYVMVLVAKKEKEEAKIQ